MSLTARFGNLTTLAFETKTEVDLTPEDRVWMEEHRQDNATVTDPDKFHIFDLPLGIVAGENAGPELIKRLSAGYDFQRHFYVETIRAD